MYTPVNTNLVKTVQDPVNAVFPTEMEGRNTSKPTCDYQLLDDCWDHAHVLPLQCDGNSDGEALASQVESTLHEVVEDLEEMYEYPDELSNHLRLRNSLGDSGHSDRFEREKLVKSYPISHHKSNNYTSVEGIALVKSRSEWLDMNALPPREPKLKKYHLLYSNELSDSSEEENCGVSDTYFGDYPVDKAEIWHKPSPAIILHDKWQPEEDLEMELSFEDEHSSYSSPHCHGKSLQLQHSSDSEQINRFYEVGMHSTPSQDTRTADHHFSPLHSMSIVQLRQLIQTLEAKVQGESCCCGESNN